MASLGNTSDPSGNLIAASTVKGTTVYDTKLDKLGSVEDVMLDKKAGRIAYAILSFGGFLGMGEKYYPLPWERLTYNTEIGGYVVDVDRDTLEGAPSYTDAATASWNDEAWNRGLHSHYGIEPYWSVWP